MHSAVSIFSRHAPGNIINVAGIGRDITALKNIEKDLRGAPYDDAPVATFSAAARPA